MKTLLTVLLMVSAAFGQEKAAPAQGAPPKNLTERPDGHFSANGDPANSDKYDVYVVKQGDTLSQIAGQVMKNSGLWPQLWEQNEQIVNPHWIYPNDKILIRPVTVVSQATPPPPAPPAAAEAVPEPPSPSTPQRARFVPRPNLTPLEPRPLSRFNTTPRPSAPEIKASDMYCSGFIRQTTVPTDLKVIAKMDADEGALGSEGDYVYVGRGAEDGLRTGDLFQVVRKTRAINDAQHNSLGTHYLDVARIRVVMTQPDFSMARVVSTCEPLEIGDIMMPFVQRDPPAIPTKRPFSPTMTASGDVKGQVVMTLGALSNFGTAFKTSGVVPGAHSGYLGDLDNGVASPGTIVYIDVGLREGVKPGDSFIIYAPADKDQELYGLPEDAKKLKGYRVAVGELIVLKVEERAATALVTYATGAISAGLAVERR